MTRFTASGMVVFAACLTWSVYADDARPAVIVPASSDRAVVTVHLTGIDKPEAKDIEAGTLVNSQYPDQRIVPKVTPTTISGKDKDWDMTLTVEQLLPFGDSVVPLLYRGEQKQTLHFFKAGLVPKPSNEGGFSVREGSPLLIVLENPTASDYPVVRVRLRFQNVEVCEATADKFVATASHGDNSKCDDPNQWASFSIPKYAPITLRVAPSPEWFRDLQTGFPQGAKRKGVLSVRFQGDSANGSTPPIYEQNTPLEVQFNPDDSSIGLSLLRVTFWLLVGALLALILRVTIPNYRWKKQLKGQLRKVEKATRTISDEVDSMLRVLLHVERLALDQLRRSAWVSEPSYPEIAQRVEQGLATLQRKIGYARRLDNAKGRRALLMDEAIAPTRLDAIDTQLNLAGQALMRDQISDQDWVFIQQRLEASDKLLSEPTQEEKDALDALLVQRWKSIRDFYITENHELRPLPKELDGMDACFPEKADLPKETDDGSQWVKEVGSVRADLRLTALSLVREFYFFEPSKEQKRYWDDAKTKLADLLSTPAIEDITAARLLLSELAEEVDVDKITKALVAREAEIEVDPQFVAPYEKTRLTVRFRSADLNTAAARREVECDWEFEDQHAKEKKADVEQGRTPYRERGWETYYYFEDDVVSSAVTVRFYVDGKVLLEAPEVLASSQLTKPLEYRKTLKPTERAGIRRERSERRGLLIPEALQLGAALLVPLAALAVTQAGQGASGRWWDLVGVGFGSEMIRNILTGKSEQTNTQAQQSQQPQ